MHVERDVEPAAARLVDELERALALALVGLARQEVRDLDLRARLLADADRLVDRRDGALVAPPGVARIQAAALGNHLAELDQLLVGRAALGGIFETRRIAEGALLQSLLQ